MNLVQVKNRLILKKCNVLFQHVQKCNICGWIWQGNISRPSIMWLRNATWFVRCQTQNSISWSQSYGNLMPSSNQMTKNSISVPPSFEMLYVKKQDNVNLEKDLWGEEKITECSINEATSQGRYEISNKTIKKRTAATELPDNRLRKSPTFLLNYVQACVNAGFIDQAVDSVLKRLHLSNQDIKSVDYLLYSIANLSYVQFRKSNDLLQKVVFLFDKVVDSNLSVSLNMCSSSLAAVQKFAASSAFFDTIQEKIEHYYSMQDCLENCNKQNEEYTYVKKAILKIYPDFRLQEKKQQMVQLPIMLKDLYESNPSNESIRLSRVCSSYDLLNHFEQQLEMEKAATVCIPNVLKCDKKLSKTQNEFCAKLNKLHERWFSETLIAFRDVKCREHKRWLDGRTSELGVYPFFCLLPDETYVNIIINYLAHLPRAGELTHATALAIGDSVFSRYFLKHYLNHNSKKLKDIYKEYMKVYETQNQASVLRDLWEKLEQEHGKLMLKNQITSWENLWKILIGNKLLEVMVTSLTLDIGNENVKAPSAFFKNIPAIFNAHKPWGKKIYGMTLPHPMYSTLVEKAKSDFLFESKHLPMLVPPIPWLNQDQGGFLCSPSDFVRKTDFGEELLLTEDSSSNEKSHGLVDSLNVLSAVAWKINEHVLDVQLKIFRGKGNKKLKIPPEPSKESPSMRFFKHLPPDEKKKVASEYYKEKKLRNEMSGLHAEGLYKFSVANYYRDKIFWLPHNVDFRGRTYPTPPHFNYMGDDVSRSLFLFAKGQPLGKKGLDWLKIHLVNLTGLKKYGNLKERIEYADEILEDIFDSADHPLEGKCWWMKSEEPWQTLAACVELAGALRSPEPEKFISHLPIYQDGSCNGLQHYAALGRDVKGAKQVNLTPSEYPQDIYKGVALAVDELRKEDARNGIKIAQELEGYINRKVVKQTVMTTVYGVTRYGGGLQVKRQLLGLENFPQEKCSVASAYIVNTIFRSISTIFTSATRIQEWLTDIAKCMAKGGQCCEWETLLGLRAVQPYTKDKPYRVNSPVQQLTLSVPTSVPNVIKQSNAFPPNFVHSLDATHMMLTALHCFHHGITFTAVHDCYWTHASTVDAMNSICRDQFVALHSHPILESLTDHLSRFLPSSTDKESENFIAQKQRDTLRKLLRNIPEKGDFDLEQVKKSTFFFS